MVYDCVRAPLSHKFAGWAPQNPSQWTVKGVSGIGGEYSGLLSPAVLEPVVYCIIYILQEDLTSLRRLATRTNGTHDPLFLGKPYDRRCDGPGKSQYRLPSPFRESILYWDDNFDSSVAIKYDTVPHCLTECYY